MSNKNSTSILFPVIDASTRDKANTIAALITKARKSSLGGVPLTQDEQEQLDNWLAESDHNITLYTQLTNSEYLNMLRSIDLKVELREIRKLYRSQYPTLLSRIWRYLKSGPQNLFSFFNEKIGVRIITNNQSNADKN